MIDPVTSAVSTRPSTAGQVASEVEKGKNEAVISDFNDFLTLLTAQIRNQNPTEPLDSTQFVEQLASFAAVEQQVGTNAKLSELIAQGASGSFAEVGGWIGQTVESDEALFELRGEGVTLDIPVEADATAVEVLINDREGNEVARLSADPEGGAFEWSGDTTDGSQAPTGLYSATYIYQFEDSASIEREASAEGRVAEVRLDGKEALLRLADGSLIPAGSVTSIRSASVGEE